MKILMVEPGKKPYSKEIENTLASMQELVGGAIESLYTEKGDAIILNEEGKILGLPPNRCYAHDIFAGNFFIAGINGDAFTSLSDEKLSYYSEIFQEPLLVNSKDIGEETWEYEL